VAYRSYLIAFRNAGVPAARLFWDTATPYHYLRPVRIEGESLVLLGGCDHKAGHEAAPLDRYRQLEQFARERFGEIDVVRRWSAQLYEPARRAALRGPSPLAKRTVRRDRLRRHRARARHARGADLADLVLGQPESELARCCGATRVPTPRAVGARPPRAWTRCSTS
jgi:hypothetical protein